jgi:hypothetical protein
MRNLITIFCIFIFLILSSVCPEKPLPGKIQLNELITWDTKRDMIQLSDGWLQMSETKRDSLRTDAWQKMETIKQYK